MSSVPSSVDLTAICNRSEIPTPCYLVHLGLLESNLRVLKQVQDCSGARIILALKGFAMHAVFPRLRRVLLGTTASSIHEARLGREEFGGELHAYFVAYTEDELRWLSEVANHITFNSLSQWKRFRPLLSDFDNRVSFGVRINPEYSEIQHEMYNPCCPGSRFGVSSDQLCDADLTGIEGLHFHTMCEQNADTLVRTLEHVERRFGGVLRKMKWLNMGGGHHITLADYNVELLCEAIRRIREHYDLTVYLEPGEAVALNTGFLVASVLDRFRSGNTEIAILDTSASAHTPDVLEMPYRPVILEAGSAFEKRHTVTLGGTTCLAGDVFGDYSFDQPVEIGQRLIFTDMAHYTMVKNTMFNGVPLPSIATYDPDSDKVTLLRSFGYEDYRNRLS